ncbi:MAG: hypothetical protein A6F70_06205 [Cycloclasticus sp. symbiont of Bathymodiolus heckerae]|nr:MAG: hypothetical protein A6F70_06205 [Cycloclasticus sp. symbiont of Bathymodiolus heckerae]
MNILRILLVTSIFTLLLGCAGDEDALSKIKKDFTINGIFGIKLGVINKELPEGYIIENKEISFTPDKADDRFVQYQYSTTPKSHVIYGIKVKSHRELSKENCLSQRDALIKSTLETLGDTPSIRIFEEKNKWKIREGNQREITIDCEPAVSSNTLQLVMICQDTALSLLAFKEWKKRQTEITLIRF